MTRRRPPPGFTLIEIVLVIVVMAVAGVLAAPALQPALEAVRAESAARRTASFLDKARSRAVLERKTVVVRCRPADNHLEVSLEGQEGQAAQEGEPGTRPFRIPEKVDLVSCRPEEVRYQPQGSATGLALLLRDRRGREYRITVGAFTGLARVEAGP